MNSFFLIFVAFIISLAVVLLAVLVLLGSPKPAEPSFIKAMRFNMWAETLGLLGYGLLHPRLFSYRATKTEQKLLFPGDNLVPAANAGATYAITINASADKIWPWLLQMGSGRALWYSWSPAHAFPEYKHHLSPFTIHPEWQNLRVGDVVLDGDALNQCSENKGAWRVKEIINQRTIVFFSARDFVDGIEFDPQRARPDKIYGITSWVFNILPAGEKDRCC